ncbi:hypothetical protein MAHJHV35_48200 [Mycobacterium avium subsp. hominissuis]
MRSRTGSAVVMSRVSSSSASGTAEPVRDRIVVRHPLQPFVIRNVIPDELVPGVPFSFDPTVLRAARAARWGRN